MPNADDAAAAFAWDAHPAREQVGRAVFGVAVVIVLSVITGTLMQSSAWAIGATVGLIFALNRFFLPSRFAIDDEGITAEYPLGRRRRRWNELRRFVHDDQGGYLSTRARPSRFDRRGLHVMFGAHAATAIEAIEARLDAGGRPCAP